MASSLLWKDCFLITRILGNNNTFRTAPNSWTLPPACHNPPLLGLRNQTPGTSQATQPQPPWACTPILQSLLADAHFSEQTFNDTLTSSLRGRCTKQFHPAPRYFAWPSVHTANSPTKNRWLPARRRKRTSRAACSSLYSLRGVSPRLPLPLAPIGLGAVEGRGLSLRHRVGARAAALFFRAILGRGARRPRAACASISARVPAGTLPPVSSESVGPLGSTWRGSGARIQTSSRLLRAKSARTVGGWERPCDRRAGGLCARLAEQRGWPGEPVLRLVPRGAAEWTVADRTTRVKTRKPCAYPSCTLRSRRRPCRRVRATQCQFRPPARFSPSPLLFTRH